MTRSKINSQGKILVPAEVCRRLGFGPGSLLEWHDEAGKIFLSPAGRQTWEDAHRALFPDGPPKPHSLAELRQGLRRNVVKRYTRG